MIVNIGSPASTRPPGTKLRWATTPEIGARTRSRKSPSSLPPPIARTSARAISRS
jgi:hypothetical protein